MSQSKRWLVLIAAVGLILIWVVNRWRGQTRRINEAALGAETKQKTVLPRPAALPIRAHPSFDCLKARTWAESAICSTPELGDVDREMADLYAKTLAVLSGLGKSNVRQAQKE